MERKYLPIRGIDSSSGYASHREHTAVAGIDLFPIAPLKIWFSRTEENIDLFVFSRYESIALLLGDEE